MQSISSESTSSSIAAGQYAELRKQIPLLYALLAVNSIAVSYTLRLSAPFWLTVPVPAFLVLVCVIRGISWLRGRRPTDIAAVRRKLSSVLVLGCILAAVFIVWGLALHSYGTVEERAHVAGFLAVTVIGCIFCLMYLPVAAIAIATIVMVPYLAFSFYSREPIYITIACNAGLVTLVMIRVMMNSYGGFEELVRSRGEAKRLSSENVTLTNIDKLTGLPNRRFFFAELARVLEAARETRSFVVVGIVDLDRFKPINDTYGHAVGDLLLEAVAQRLLAIRNTQPGLILARLGGDEFGFIGPFELPAARAIGSSLCGALTAPFEIDDLVLTLGASCGLAQFPETGSTAHDLFNGADYALYQSKKTHRGQVCVYSKDDEREIQSEDALERALAVADLAGETQLVFQPVVDFEAGQVQFVEALARWNSPILGPVRPDRFIAAAERMGLIHDLTLVLFRKAVDALSRLPPDVSLSFNLSAQDVINPPTVLSIVSIVRQSGIDPRRLMLELTETAVMQDFQQADQSVALLRSLGIGIALDDFGTGYSSLSYLHRLPIDKVKIDRSFVNALQDMSGYTLLRSMLTLCRSMALDCVIEGVETVEQLAMLRELGARAFQGYLFAKPMPLADLLRWMSADKAEPVRAIRKSA